MPANKPQTFNGDLQNLPPALDELKTKRNWVLWKLECVDGRWQKPPYHPNGSLAKVNEAETWSSFPDVMTAFASGEFDGIGFVLLDAHLGAFDLDKCRDLASNEIAPHAKEIMNWVGSYQEISPSGTGIRIIGRAIGANCDRKEKGVEYYRNAPRYITITGNALNNGADLSNIDAYIDAKISSHTASDSTHNNRPNFIDCDELMPKEFEPIKWILSPYITEGCSLLVGRPKLGKSWMVLQIGMAVSVGGMTLNAQCEQGDVLCCALEDNERRLKFRLTGLQRLGATMDAKHIKFLTEMPRINAGAIAFLTEWVERVKNPRLIIIDCLEKIRPPIGKRETAYSNDYASLEQLRTFANKHHVAIIVVHHDRKLDAEHPFDTVSGTLGLSGAADTVMIVKKERNGHVLYAQGRDIPSVEHAVEPNSTNDVVVWHVLGDAVQVRINEQRKTILQVLTDEPQSPKQIAKAINQKIANVSKTLQRMYTDGIVEWCGQGQYRLRTTTQQ
jgi:hypothetical protein